MAPLFIFPAVLFLTMVRPANVCRFDIGQLQGPLREPRVDTGTPCGEVLTLSRELLEQGAAVL